MGFLQRSIRAMEYIPVTKALHKAEQVFKAALDVHD
jgi:hypothetical protein